MILPKKHIKLEQSLFGIAAIILTHLKYLNDLDKLYNVLMKDERINKSLTFEIMVLAIDFLYMSGILGMSKSKGVVLCD